MLYVFSSIYKVEGASQREKREYLWTDYASYHNAIHFKLIKKGIKREISLWSNGLGNLFVQNFSMPRRLGIWGMGRV